VRLVMVSSGRSGQGLVGRGVTAGLGVAVRERPDSIGLSTARRSRSGLPRLGMVGRDQAVNLDSAVVLLDNSGMAPVSFLKPGP